MYAPECLDIVIESRGASLAESGLVENGSGCNEQYILKSSLLMLSMNIPCLCVFELMLFDSFEFLFKFSQLLLSLELRTGLVVQRTKYSVRGFGFLPSIRI